MSPSNTCSSETCQFHREHDLLIKQHDDKIQQIDSIVDDMSGDVKGLTTRTTLLMWFIGGALAILCAMSAYGVVQINQFKETYQKDVIKYVSVIEHMKNDINNINGRLLNNNK